MTLASVETAIKKQADEINAVRYGFANVVNARSSEQVNSNPAGYILWGMAYNSDDVNYVNTVVNSTLSGVDTTVNSAQVGQGLFNPWFTLHNTYFSQNNASYPDPVTPSNKVTTLANAVANYYRWRVGYYFNQTMGESVGVANDVASQNVFPAHASALGQVVLTGSTALFTPTASMPGSSLPSGSVTPFSTTASGSTTYNLNNPVYSGPGVLGVYTTSAGSVGATGGTYGVVCYYEQSPYSTNNSTPATSASFSVYIPPGATSILGATASPAVIIGEAAGQFGAGPTSYNSSTGAITVTSVTPFVVGQKVLIASGSLTGLTAVYTEVAEVYSISTGATSVSVCKAMGGPSPSAAAIGVRYGATAFAATGPNNTNVFYGGGYVYPLFAGVQTVSRTSGGTNNDTWSIAFVADRPQVI